MAKGLYSKYKVFKASTGEQVKEKCFVLIPSKDKAARHALLSYAAFTDDKQLGEDIEAWVYSLKEAKNV